VEGRIIAETFFAKSWTVPLVKFGAVEFIAFYVTIGKEFTPVTSSVGTKDGSFGM